MSEVGRYRRAYPRLFRHPGFKMLTPLGQRLATYVLFGPQSNRIGLFFFSVAVAAEDLQTTPKSLRKALMDLTGSFGWTFDATAHVLWVPSWWRWNRPDHGNILEGNLKDLNEIPPCGLVDAFMHNLEHLDPKLHETFLQASKGRLGKAPAAQYQNQEQKQGTEHAAAATKDDLRRTTNTARQERTASNGGTNNGDDGDKRTIALVQVAHQTLRYTNPHAPIDEQVDAFHSVYQGLYQGRCTREEAVRALNVALQEQAPKNATG